MARRIGIIVCLLCFCLCIISHTAQAASTIDAKEPIATDRTCDLTISYGYDGSVFPDQMVKLYRIADVSADFQYMLTQPFMASGLTLNGVQTQGEWNVIRSTLETHIFANDIVPSITLTTDAQGQASFTGLQPGLYLASAVTVTLDAGKYFFDSALVALPGLGDDGLWQYQVAVAAKPEYLPTIQPDEQIERKVLKLWRGDNGKNVRPKNIQVEIFRDGILVETVTLSESNNWSYSWSANDDGANWKVVERNIPNGYTMTVEERETTFVLTNNWLPDNPERPDPPKTGDTSNIMLYITLMYLSGMALIILGILGKRKRHEETNEN